MRMERAKFRRESEPMFSTLCQLRRAGLPFSLAKTSSWFYIFAYTIRRRISGAEWSCRECGVVAFGKIYGTESFAFLDAESAIRSIEIVVCRENVLFHLMFGRDAFESSETSETTWRFRPGSAHDRYCLAWFGVKSALRNVNNIFV